MATNHNGKLERALDFIRQRGLATRRDLHDAIGIKLSSVDGLLSRHIDAGIVITEHTKTEESSRAITCYRWNDAAVPGTRPLQHLRRAKPRVCLGCGREFASAGPMNRMCTPCRTRAENASPYAP